MQICHRGIICCDIELIEIEAGIVTPKPIAFPERIQNRNVEGFAQLEVGDMNPNVINQPALMVLHAVPLTA